MPDNNFALPKKWLPRPPDGRSAGTLSQFIREHLVRNGGACTKDDLLGAIREQPALFVRLERGRGLSHLLDTMRRGGFVTLEGPLVRASARTLRQTLV